MTKQRVALSRAGSLLLALTMLSLAIFKAQACQSTPAQPDPQPEQVKPAPVEPIPQEDPAPAPNAPTSPASDMTKPAQDMAADQIVEPDFWPGTKSGAFMFKERPIKNKAK